LREIANRRLRTLAVTVTLVLSGAAPYFAQGPMAGPDGAAGLSVETDGDLPSGPVLAAFDLATPGPESPDAGFLTQASAPPAQASAPPASQQQSSASQQNSSSGTQSQRKLDVNPVTGLVSTTEASYIPLTGEERWRLYWKMNFFSVGAYFGPFFSALVLDQSTGSPAAWGGGFEGYGRRVGSRTASAVLQGTFQAPAAYLLHEDVRYIVSKQHGFGHRALHAIAYSFLTYNSSGHPTVNIANLSAYYGSTAVSTAWLPGHYKVLDYTLSNSSEQILLTFPVNLLQEFWPEISRPFHRHRD